MGKSDPKAVGLRLRAVMVELGFTDTQDFARALGNAPSALSNWMNGYNRPNVEAAGRLLQLIPEITLDWLYFGDEAKLTRGLALRLDISVKAFEQGLEVPVVAPVPRPAVVRAVQSRRPRSSPVPENGTLLREKA